MELPLRTLSLLDGARDFVFIFLNKLSFIHSGRKNCTETENSPPRKKWTTQVQHLFCTSAPEHLLGSCPTPDRTQGLRPKWAEGRAGEDHPTRHPQLPSFPSGRPAGANKAGCALPPRLTYLPAGSSSEMDSSTSPGLPEPEGGARGCGRGWGGARGPSHSHRTSGLGPSPAHLSAPASENAGQAGR